MAAPIVATFHATITPVTTMITPRNFHAVLMNELATVTPVESASMTGLGSKLLTASVIVFIASPPWTAKASTNLKPSSVRADKSTLNWLESEPRIASAFAVTVPVALAAAFA